MKNENYFYSGFLRQPFYYLNHADVCEEPSLTINNISTSNTTVVVDYYNYDNRKIPLHQSEKGLSLLTVFMYSALTSSATVRSLTTAEEVELPPILLRLEAVAALGKRRILTCCWDPA